MAVGLAGGGFSLGAGGVQLVAVESLVLLAIAAARPGRSGLLWVAVAVAVVSGAARVSAIDRSATPVAAGPLSGEVALLRAPLPASSRERTSTAIATLGGRSVIVSAPRFGVPSPALPRGALVTVTGSLKALGDLPGDARLARQGVAGRVLTTAIGWSGTRRGGVLGQVDRFGDAAQHLLVRAVGARRGALLAGMALGTADGITAGDRDALRASGLWHLVAASGGNIALVVALAMAVLWLVGVPDRWRLAASALTVVLYVPLAGGGPSIVRAGVMGLIGLSALASGREHRGADALAAAAAVTLALDPRGVLDVGWQLSFAAAAALLVFGGRLARVLESVGAPRWIAVGLGCTAVATIATAPITLLVFGQLSLIGLVANALVLPLVGVAVWSGATAAVFTPLSPALASVCAQPGGVAAGLMLHVADWSQGRTFAVVGATGAGAVLAGCLLAWVVRPPRPAVLATAAAAIAFLVLSRPHAPTEPRLLVLDVGQGSAALLQDGSEGMLVDTGPPGGGVVAELRRAGVRHLKAIVLSHPAADHDGGAAAVLAAFPTDVVLDGGEPGGGPTHDAAIRVAARRHVRVVPVRAGQQLSFGRVRVRIRWPTPYATTLPGDPNNRAAVIQTTIGALTAIIPADAEGNVLKNLGGMHADVLVVSHHGSADPDLPTVLAHVHPQLAVISVGLHNTYGHPNAATLASLNAAHVSALRTDLDGTVDIRRSAGGALVVRHDRRRQVAQLPGVAKTPPRNDHHDRLTQRERAAELNQSRQAEPRDEVLRPCIPIEEH